MHLTLFFTNNTSLKNWDRVGMLDREVAIYRKYMEKGVKVSFVTYGHKDRMLYTRRLDGIEILCNERRLPNSLYTKLIPLLHASALRKTDIIKSNQTPGALTALAAARFHKKPMLARCGYMHSEFIERERGEHSKQAIEALNYESKLFSAADGIEVTTPMMQESIEKRISGTNGKVTVIPNYVNTELFAPSSSVKDIDILFIGRLNPQKNLQTLLKALQGLKLKIAIIGKGPLEDELKSQAQGLELDIEWPGNIPNPDLPNWLNRSKIFVLPSHYEGHPKTLIEAMATGLPVIGGDAPGIREIISHLKTGWLCPTDTGGIREAVEELMASEALRQHLSNNARGFAIDKYSLGTIAEQELNLLDKLMR